VRPPSILLRLLLSLTLVLNGVSTAFASVGMEGMSHTTQATSAHQAHKSPCEGHGAPMAMHDGSHEGGGKHPPTGDCCTSPACVCNCVSPVAVALFDLAWRPAHIPHVAETALIIARHQAPALPHLIRPPIG
jgi:hypothetical protein